MKSLRITFQEFGRGPVSTRRFASLAAAASYIADRWQGDEYRDGPASFHTDCCAYQCHGFTLDQVRLAQATERAARPDPYLSGGTISDGHYHTDEDGPGVNGPEPVFQAGLDDGETGYCNGIHWSDPRADHPSYGSF